MKGIVFFFFLCHLTIYPYFPENPSPRLSSQLATSYMGATLPASSAPDCRIHTC